MGRRLAGIEIDERHHRTASKGLASKFNQPGVGQSRFRPPILVEPVASKSHTPDTTVDVQDDVPFLAPVLQARKPAAVMARAFKL